MLLLNCLISSFVPDRLTSKAIDLSQATHEFLVFTRAEKFTTE